MEHRGAVTRQRTPSFGADLFRRSKIGQNSGPSRPRGGVAARWQAGSAGKNNKARAMLVHSSTIHPHR
jgi:hypothetical protein